MKSELQGPGGAASSARRADLEFAGRMLGGFTAIAAAAWVYFLAGAPRAGREPIDLLSTADAVFALAYLRACGAFMKAGKRRLSTILWLALFLAPLYLRGRDFYFRDALPPDFVLLGPALLLFAGMVAQDIVTGRGQAGEPWFSSPFD